MKEEGKKAKTKSGCLSMVGWAVVMMLIGVVGKCMGRMSFSGSNKEKLSQSVLVPSNSQLSYDEELERAAQKTNIKLPIKLDDITSWTSIVVADSALVYVYEVDNNDFDLGDLDLSQYKQKKIEGLYTNKTELYREIELCVLTNRAMTYHIIPLSGNSDPIDIVVDNQELQNIIK